MNKEKLFEIRTYLLEQEAECIDQTGVEASMGDIICHISSPEFIERFGEISIETLFLDLLRT